VQELDQDRLATHLGVGRLLRDDLAAGLAQQAPPQQRARRRRAAS
jgi:hypothetical protein